MKLTAKRVALFFCLSIIAGLVYLIIELRRLDEEMAASCDPGFGKTTVKLRVLDLNSKKPIDSVQLAIRFGASGHKLVDTLLAQKDEIAYTFFIPEVDKCDDYWLEISNKRYWRQVYFGDMAPDYSVRKGTVSTSTLYLNPAAKVKVRLEKSEQILSDTVYLYFERKDNKEHHGWDYFACSRFRNGRKAFQSFTLEGGVDYRAMWIQKSADGIDTTYSEFHTEPFGTLRLRFVLKDLSRK